MWFLWTTQDACDQGSKSAVQHAIPMKSITFRLTKEEVELVDLVTRNSKFRHYKDPKEVYMRAMMEAVKMIIK